MKRFAAGGVLMVSLLAASVARPQDVTFIDVNLIAMDRERVEPHQTVVVHGQTIAAIGPVGSTPVPAGSVRVRGEGRLYLTPGLADMHTHVSEESDLALYLAHGVTTLLHMGGTEQRLIGHIRGDIDRGEVPGPQMFFSLMLDGSDAFGILHVNNPELARDAVRVAKANGYDFIKIYNNLTSEEFDAVVDEGHHEGLPVIGHGVRAVGLPAALFRGQVMVAHAEEFLYTAFDRHPDEKTVASVVADVKKSGAYVTPTLSTYRALSAAWGRPRVVAAWLREAQARELSPMVRLHWNRSFYVRRAPEDLAPALAFQRRLTLLFQRATVPLLAGTDSPEVPGTYPGASIHAELKELVACGLTPFEALAAATRNAGDFIHQSHPDRQEFGRISPGARADLALVAANPLKDIDAMDHLIGVLAGGRWLDRSAIRHLLAERRHRYENLDEVR